MMIDLDHQKAGKQDKSISAETDDNHLNPTELNDPLDQSIGKDKLVAGGCNQLDRLSESPNKEANQRFAAPCKDKMVAGAGFEPTTFGL